MNNAYKLHAGLIKTGRHNDLFFLRRLLLFCATSSSPVTLSYARSVFAHIPSPDTVAYNTIIRVHAASAPSIALSFFSGMRHASVSPDHFTLPFALKAASRLLPLDCRHLHSLEIKLGFHPDVYVCNALISFYGCSGSVTDAWKVFDDMSSREVVSWSSMVSAFVNNSFPREGLDLFREMQLLGDVLPDEVMMLSIVSAVATLGALELGRWVDAYICRSELNVTLSLGTALVDMYSRCGSVDDSRRVFDEMPVRNVLTWTALINGLAVHGCSTEALRMFYEMKRSGPSPDNVTFKGVLVACSYGGLVDDGWRIFESIRNEYDMEPELEHYGCMVDLLGRAGLLDDAFKFVERMPCKPNAVIWRTLLGACVNHNNLTLAEKVKAELNRLDPSHDGDYVLLSNAYAGVGRFNEKAAVRGLMQEKRIGKNPGYSLLTVDQEIHEFVCGDKSHPQTEKITNFLIHIIDSLKAEGYAPNTSNVFHDIEEEEKEQSVSYHSEKLAVAFALLNVEGRKTIRVMKNLRTCHDCHCFMKHVSRKFDREIIVRDRNRFHHFRNGICSCKDFW